MRELDRKYRPRRFSDIVGNNGIIRLLLARSRNGSLAGRSMLFGGAKGCGKTSLARIVARAIACSSLQNGEPCNECTGCVSVLDETSTSFDEFDAATGGTVERMREIIDDLDFGSFDGKPRVIILDEAQRLTKNSQDALLKVMEERRLVAILCTTEVRKIADAMRSRVEEYPVTAPESKDLIGFLERICKSENIEYETEALDIVAKMNNRCPRDSVCSLDTLSLFGKITQVSAREYFRFDSYEQINDMLRVLDTDPSAAFALLDELVLREGPTWVRDTLVFAIASAVRAVSGSRSNFPVPLDFWPSREMRWTALASSLGIFEKPCVSDLEAALLTGTHFTGFHFSSPPKQLRDEISPKTEEFNFNLSTALAEIAQSVAPLFPPETQAVGPTKFSSGVIHASVQTSLAPKSVEPTNVAPPVIAPVASSVKVKSTEIDGVKFTSDEVLTSLDNKIDKTPSGPPTKEETSHRVEFLSKEHVPIPEKDFAKGLIKGFKGLSKDH